MRPSSACCRTSSDAQVNVFVSPHAPATHFCKEFVLLPLLTRTGAINMVREGKKNVNSHPAGRAADAALSEAVISTWTREHGSTLQNTILLILRLLPKGGRVCVPGSNQVPCELEEKLLHSEGDRALAQVARARGVSFSVGIQSHLDVILGNAL